MPSARSPRELRGLLWTARITATLVAGFVVLMVVGYTMYPQGNPPTPHEALLLTLFTVGLCAGYVIAWLWPLVGGVLTWVCIVAFVAAQQHVAMAFVVAILGIPGILFIAYGVLRRQLAAAGPG